MSPAPQHSPQQIETLVLDAAAKCIAETSLLDFTMAAIAKEASMSMGSIYKHVQSKEDVLVALATRMVKQHHEAFTELLAFPLTMPERLMCTILLSPEKLHTFPFGVHLEMLTGNEAVLQRASPRWVETLARFDQAIEAVFNDALTDSWVSGELRVDENDRDQAIEMLLVSLWSMSVGFIQVAYQRHTWHLTSSEHDLPFPLAADHPLVDGAQRLINSVAWDTPLDDAGIHKACAVLEEKGYR